MNSEAKLKIVESQNICNLNKNSTLFKMGQVDESPLPIDLNMDDRVANLVIKQNSTQKNFDSRNRINSVLLSQTNINIKSKKDLNMQLRSNKQSRSKVNSNHNHQSSSLETRKIYEEGYEKGLNENLAKYLGQNFNDLEKYLQPNQMNELRKSQNVKALQKTYSAVSTCRLIQSTLNLTILFIGSYFIDDLKLEWQDFWLALSGMIGIQVVLFVIGMLANIYWRFDSSQNENNKGCLKINQKCDILFLAFYFIEFLFLTEFILLKDTIYQTNYKYMLIELILRAAIISSAYAFILQKKKYFFLIFLTFIIYIPARQSSEWCRYFTSNVQIIFSSLSLMIIVYNVRFQFKDRVDEAYKTTIFAYKDIISDLCLRLKQPQNQTQNSNLAEIIQESNERIPMPITEKPQTDTFKPKKRRIPSETQQNNNQNTQISKQLCCELFDQKESFLIDLIESISEGYCLTDENLNPLKINDDMLKFFEADSFQECLNIIFYSGLTNTNGEGEGQTQFQDKSKQSSQEHPQSQVFNFNQLNNYDTVRKDSQQRRGTIIEIMDIDTSPMTNFHDKYNRLSAGKFFKIQHLFNNNSLEGNTNQNQINEFIDQSFQSKQYEQITPKQKPKDLKINGPQQRQIQNQPNCIGSETIILKEIHLIISQLKVQKKSQLNSSNKGQGKAEILQSHQKNFYVKFTSVNNNQQSIYLFLRVTPIVKDNKIFFLIDASNKTLFQSYCNLENLYYRQQSIIRGFTEETYYSIHYLIQKLQESRQYCSSDFSKFHVDPILSQVFILQNTLQILFEISNKKKPFSLNLQVENLNEFLEFQIIDIFNYEAQSKKIQLKIETDNDVPSQVSTDFEKLKIILTIIIQNYMNFIQENQSIIINIKNQSLQSGGEADFSYGEENQNFNQNKLNAFLLQFNIYLSYSSPVSPGEEKLRIQQIFTQSLKNSQDQTDQNKSFFFGNPQCIFNQNYPNQNSPYQHINISRKSSFYKKKPCKQQQLEETFQQINNIQVSNIVAQKLVGPLFNQINLKSSIKLNSGLQFENNEKGFPCVSFFIESQSVIHYEKDNSTKFTAHPADNSQNIFQRQTTDTYSPIYYSYRQPPNKHKLEEVEKDDDIQEGLIQIEKPLKVQPTSLHNFPKTKSIVHINQHESRKQSIISNINSMNEIYRAEDQGLLDATNNNINQHTNTNKKMTQNPKSLSGLPFDFNIATTTAQSTHNYYDLEENNQIGQKNNKPTLKLENIPEMQILEISKEVALAQNDNEANLSNQKKNTQLAMKYVDKNARQADSSPKQKNIFQQSNKTNKEVFFQNKQMPFSKPSPESSNSVNSPCLKKRTDDGGMDYDSYKDLPSSLSLYPNSQNFKLQYQDEIIVNSKPQQNVSGFDSMIFQQNQKNENQFENTIPEMQAIQNSQNKQVLSKTQVDQLTGQQSQINLSQQSKKIDQEFQKINRGLALSNNEYSQAKNLLVSGNQVNDDSTTMHQNQPTPLFSATQHSKTLPKLEIAQSVKQSSNQVVMSLEKKQILFVDKHQLYHTQFQQVLSQYAKEQEDESFQSAYTVEECISLIENQYYQNRYQYPYIFIDNKMLNEGNNYLIDSIKQIFSQYNTQFESLIFICSNQYFDSSCFFRFGITSSLKKPVTLKELEEKKIILQKKSYQITTLSQSFSPIPIIKAQNEIFY